MEQSAQPISEETSRRITSLRFLLAVLVVFIHNNFTAESIAKTFEETGRTIPFCQNAFGQWVQLFISGGIAQCAVPLFFLFAAFLQGVKNDSYPVLLKKKAKSLALPYVLWMSVYVLYFGVLKLAVAKVAPQVLARPDATMLTWTAKDWIAKLIGFGEFNRFLTTEDFSLPTFAAQFWFVRDLLILMLVSPAIRFLIKKFPAGFFVFSAAVYVIPLPVWFVQTQAFFFYIIGLYWSASGFDLPAKIDKIKWSEAAVLFVLAFIFTHTIGGGTGTTGYWLMVIFACVLLLKTSAFIARNKKLFAAARSIAPFSFFLYAIHMPVLNELLKKLWLRFFPMTNTFFSLFEYFGVPVLTVAIGTGIGIALKKICPPLFSLLNGGRK